MIRKIKRLDDVRIVVEPPDYVGRWCRSIEERAKELVAWAREFEQWVRDHRSQDPVSLSVERIEPSVCSGCGAEWETMLSDTALRCVVCANCEDEVEP